MSALAIAERSIDQQEGKLPDLLKKSAEDGHAPSQYQLGKNHENGIDGFARNYALAIFWYRKAVYQGYAEAQFALGQCYEQGRGFWSRHRRKAVQLYLQAAEQGLAEAQHRLSLCYERGIGVQENASETFRWTEAAAAQNLPVARYNFGVLHELGYGVDKNAAKAFVLYAGVLCDGSRDERLTDALSRLIKSTRVGVEPESKNLLTIFPDRTSLAIGQFHTLLGNCHEALDYKVTLG